MAWSLNASETLPADGLAGTLVGRVWLPESASEIEGPRLAGVRAEGVVDLSGIAATMSSLLELPDAAQRIRQSKGPILGTLDEILSNTLAVADGADVNGAYLLAPCDLQVIKAAGVTFAGSLMERVIEERAKGDAQEANLIRGRVTQLLGDSLKRLRPGSPEALEVKRLFIEKGLWSQYLEVGIGPDAEIFTKAPVLSAVGTGADIGLHPKSNWNNPEPEVVLAVNSKGEIRGATLGNDVNLRDFEGRSALLLSKAKDNNGSCAMGPFIRLFDETFSLDHVRTAALTLRVSGEDGYELRGESEMAEISRDPSDLVSQTIGATHQYPDGVMLFLGTLFAPTEDRDTPGAGFTHKQGDIVRIQSAMFGALLNRVGQSDTIRPWTFGVRALMSNLAARGLLNHAGL